MTDATPVIDEQEDDFLPINPVIHRFVDNIDGVAMLAEQDVEPILDSNKAEYNSGIDGWTPSRDMRKVAEIPLIVAEIWRNTLGVDVFDPNHAPAVSRLLNSSEWRYLRTAPGCVR